MLFLLHTKSVKALERRHLDGDVKCRNGNGNGKSSGSSGNDDDNNNDENSENVEDGAIRVL